MLFHLQFEQIYLGFNESETGRQETWKFEEQTEQDFNFPYKNFLQTGQLLLLVRVGEGDEEEEEELDIGVGGFGNEVGEMIDFLIGRLGFILKGFLLKKFGFEFFEFFTFFFEGKLVGAELILLGEFFKIGGRKEFSFSFSRISFFKEEIRKSFSRKSWL